MFPLSGLSMSRITRPFRLPCSSRPHPAPFDTVLRLLVSSATHDAAREAIAAINSAAVRDARGPCDSFQATAHRSRFTFLFPPITRGAGVGRQAYL